MPKFAFVACQIGAERTILSEVGPPLGNWKLAFSRPGFITLKLDDSSALPPASSPPNPSTQTAADLPKDLPNLPNSPFIRCTGHALGQVQGETNESLVDSLLTKIPQYPWSVIHIWQRDTSVPGWHGFEPGPTEAITAIESTIRQRLNNTPAPLSSSPSINTIAQPGDLILDIIVVDPKNWWYGMHVAQDRPSSWPGGALPVHRPEKMLSRAYLKMAEAVAWSRFPWKPGDEVVEIGSAPGGSCQRLLEMGLKVSGVDPAEMDPQLLSHPNFTHLRGKAAQLKRRMFRKFRWLTADANVAASYTLDAVEDIVRYPGVAIEGMLLTLKMSEWSQAKDLQSHIKRIRSWGFPFTAVRQLAYNRREVCVAAWRNPKTSKPSRYRRKAKGPARRPRPTPQPPVGDSPSPPSSTS